MRRKEAIGRIVFFTDKMSPAIGGMEAHADAFIEYFSLCQEWELTLIITFKNEFDHNFLPCRKSVPVKSLSKNSVDAPHEVCAILDSLHLTKHDIIFFNSLYWVRILDSLREQYPQVRIIMRSGGNDIMQSQIDGKGETLEERQSFVVNAINKNIHHLIVNSKYSFERLSGLGIDPIKIEIIYGGVDTARFYQGSEKERDEMRKELSLPKETLLILAVCRLVEFKGLEYMIEAISLLPQSPCFHCLIIGDGPLKEDVAHWARISPNAHLITLLASTPHEEISRYFRTADIYCLTPVHHPRRVVGGTYIHTETMGRSFCEAAASALPSVGTRVGGVPEIVNDGETGFLVPERSPRDTAQKLGTLLSSPTLREKMGKEARKISEENYSWDVLFSRYKIIFQQ